MAFSKASLASRPFLYSGFRFPCVLLLALVKSAPFSNPMWCKQLMFTVCVLAIAIALQGSPAPIPVPRQASNVNTNSGTEVNANSAQQQDPSSPPQATVETTKTPIEQNSTKAIPSENAEQTISVSKLPTVTIGRDWTDWISVLLSSLLVAVTAGQLWLLRKQSGITKQQATIAAEQLALTQPRLHVESVRAGWFRVGQQPIFFVRIMNSGLIAADNASVMMRVSIGTNTVKYQQDQIITIPSSGWRECFIRYGGPLQATQLDEFDSGKTPLRISGHVIWNKQTIDYCYRYYAWPFKEARPKGLRKFVPCDFDPKLAFELSVDVGAFLIAAPDATLKADKPTKE